MGDWRLNGRSLMWMLIGIDDSATSVRPVITPATFVSMLSQPPVIRCLILASCRLLAVKRLGVFPASRLLLTGNLVDEMVGRSRDASCCVLHPQ
ncbi:hypothetical protein E0I56_005685 [Escherichia coli]|nr:hypothetical protein [Escherichia coli]